MTGTIILFYPNQLIIHLNFNQMKKHLFFGMFAAVGMTLATSCTNDENVIPSSNEAQVTFSLGLESGINTRAISDGTGINQLFYAIFDKDGNLVINYTNKEFKEEETISLVKGETYTAVFWAWDRDCEAYTIGTDNKTVTINYDKALNNDENRDAFFKNVTFTVDGNENISIVLKRAFAQLNVGIPQSEFDAAKSAGLDITQSKVEIKQAATTLNLLDGTVGGATDITFEADAIPTKTLKVDANCDGDDEEYVYLSMSYFLANDESDGASKTTLGDLKFTFSSDNGKSFILTEGLANAPVQRNHRTNIVSLGGIGGGGIITGDVTVKVLLDPLYDGEHTLTNENVWEENWGIYTEEALAGKTIKIPAGWHIRNGYILEPMPEMWHDPSSDKYNPVDDTPAIYNNPFTIDGQNNTITFEPYSPAYAVKNAFAATNGAQVTVKDLNFAGEHKGVFGGVYGKKDFNTSFENVTIIDNGIYHYNKIGDIPMSAFSALGNATLKNCNISGTYWVGQEKDIDKENPNIPIYTYNKYNGIYDVFVPNDGNISIDESQIGRIYVNNHGKLNIKNSTVEEIISNPLVAGVLTLLDGAKVTSVNITQHNNSYPPKVNIKTGATIGTLQLNDIKASNINIEDGATITKIIWNGTEYTSIADFKAAI